MRLRSELCVLRSISFWLAREHLTHDSESSIEK